MVVITDLILATDPPTSTAFLGALIGGIFGRSKAKKQAAAAEEAARVAEEASKIPLETTQKTSHEVDLAGMNAAAIAAGYNPMTLLMAGGLGGFTTSTNFSSTTGHNAMAAAEAKGTALQARASVPSFGEVLMGAAGSAIDSFVSGGLGSIFKGTSYFPPAPSGSVTGIASALGLSKPGFGSAAGGGLQFGASSTMGSGSPMMPVIKAPETTNPWRRFNIDPTTAGAEAYTQRYGEGELAETLAFGLSSWDDIWYNVTGKNSDQRYEAYGRPIVNGVKSAYDSAKTGALATNAHDAVMATGGGVWGAEKWFRNNVTNVWWPD